ncbi:MAG: electron transfer flavoprotein subunit alpha/FixB family protein [Deltaproteobacteria bacterium]|nr:electron transfer flavoprotein subunit alpha/FixB family protein [Deltaproteobacteria bacterium]
MSRQLFAYITHKNSAADDSAFELAAAAKKIDANASVTAIVTGKGEDLTKVCGQITSAFAKVWKIDGDAFAYPNAELIRAMLVKILPEKSITLLAHDTFGMDLGPGLSVKLNASFISDVVDIEGVKSDILKTIRQEYSGQVSTHVSCDITDGAVINIRPGSFKPEETSIGGEIEDKSSEAEGITAKRKYIEIIEAEIGDVDITKSEILVSVGRGIEDEENIEIAQELADAMGADVSCSRPIVDAKWLEKSRQVGTSGQTVKPKVYLALGISGSFQHLGGIKGSPFIVAVNKNAKAPIFQVADIGIVDDLLDFVPVLTEKIEELKG